VQSSILSENVLNSSWDVILTHLAASGDYGDTFNTLYPESGISEAAVENALVTFLESLSTPNAAFDRWLNGESLPERARDGYALFKAICCARCHQGVGIGGNMYASFRGYVEQKATIGNPDNGRFNVTNNEAHRYQFKVPSLRNVAVTAPYFHDGGVRRLGDAVRAMASHQLGRDLTSGEVDLIVAFLESLTGWYDERLLGANREQPAS
ncbi:MAG: cytochrome c peroxidase, partial [Gammaproteobacteria bacterium]|nr:cytochrome c peroxidase [Gammaproteobacteria bacterium]